MSEQGVLIRYGQMQAGSDDYYTPRSVFDALALRFDLDVCAPPGGVEWVPADRFFTKEEDGLSQPWTGRVWMNPPFSRTGPWVEKFIAHAHGITILAPFKSYWNVDVWAAADAIAFPHVPIDEFVGGRIRYHAYFAAFGEECVEALSRVGVVRVLKPPLTPGKT